MLYYIPDRCVDSELDPTPYECPKTTSGMFVIHRYSSSFDLKIGCPDLSEQTRVDLSMHEARGAVMFRDYYLV